MSDRYTARIERLMALPDDEVGEAIEDDWMFGKGLFQFCNPSGDPEIGCGCLTMVRGDDYRAWTPELTEAIRADEFIPRTVMELCDLRGDDLRDALERCAYWQRHMDETIRRKEFA